MDFFEELAIILNKIGGDILGGLENAIQATARYSR